MRGKVKTLKADRGFGFLAAEDGASDIFFHCTTVEGTRRFDILAVGDSVDFDLGTGPDGRPRATRVRAID